MMKSATVTKREPLSSPSRCGGDGCVSPDTWPLHHFRHRSVYSRLCTSCVLRHHAGAFCSSCFDILDSPLPPDRPLARCAKCPSVAHLTCLPDPDAATQYLCPSCSSSQAFSYFPVNEPDGRRRAIDLSSAKVLLAAGQLATVSMTRAAAAARADAERKVKEATAARRRAREMLERALLVSQKEREKAKESIETAAAAPEVVEPKKKLPKTGKAASSVKKKAHDRNCEKWKRFNEPIQVVPRPPVAQRASESDIDKTPPVISEQNHATADEKDRAGSFPDNSNDMELEERDKEMKKLLSSSQDAPTVKEEERDLTAEPNKGPQISQLTQDGLVSRTNNGAMLMCMPTTASPHS